MKCLEVNFRQCTYCLQNLGLTCIAYSFSSLHEMHGLPSTYTRKNNNNNQKQNKPKLQPNPFFPSSKSQNKHLVQQHYSYGNKNNIGATTAATRANNDHQKTQLLAFFTLFGFFRERSFRVNPIIQAHLAQKHTAPTFSAVKGERKE